jgi:hypothetical protein
MRTASVVLISLLFASPGSPVDSRNDLDAKLELRAKALYGASAKDKVTYVTEEDSATSEPSRFPDEKADAIKGDIASGVILLEADGMLYLDTRPCDSHVLSFKKPYLKHHIGSVTCTSGRRVDRFEVEKTER